MKTTLELADALFEQAKSLAQKEKTTLRALVEQGLRQILAERQGQKRGKAFSLRSASFKGKGINPDIDEGVWQQIGEIIYQGRGS